MASPGRGTESPLISLIVGAQPHFPKAAPQRAGRGEKLRVAIFCDYYLPGFRAGGPPVSISRIVERETHSEVRVITRDRDQGQTSPYTNAGVRCWTQNERALVAYLRPGLRDWPWVVRQLRTWRPDVVYANSLHSRFATLTPVALKRLGFLASEVLLLAPRGECSAGAQSQKRLKKRVGRWLIRRLLGRRLTWHASSVYESEDIQRWLGQNASSEHQTVVRETPPPAPAPRASQGDTSQRPTVLFASRIDRMKGLDTAIRALRQVVSECNFSVYGVVTDPAYFSQCIALAKSLPANILFSYEGEFRPSEAVKLFSNASVLLLPTHGENFGHVIAEAMSVGCPVITTRHTPWSELIQASGGAAVEEPDEISAVVDSLLSADPSTKVSTRYQVHEAYSAWHRTRPAEPPLFCQGELGRRAVNGWA